jgi:hypothetical protein
VAEPAGVNLDPGRYPQRGRGERLVDLTDRATYPGSATSRVSEEGELVRDAVVQARRGNWEAVHFLYVRYAPDVCAGVRDLVPGDREAQDVAESVFRELVALVEDYEAPDEPFVSWLLGIARGRV